MQPLSIQTPLVVGLNHLTASVDFRDRAYFPEEEANLFLQILSNKERFPYIQEVVILSTCNRSEVYITTVQATQSSKGIESVPEMHSIQEVLTKAWCDIKSLDTQEFLQHSYCKIGQDVIEHLFRVVGSLDSMILGENQILGQVKEAYEQAVKANTVHHYFNHLFQGAFKVGKRIRSETSLNEGAVSISYAAVELAKKVLGQDITSATVGIIGSGEMGELAASNFQRSKVSSFVFFNRSLGSAETMAAKYHGEAHSLENLSKKLYQCDIVVSATGARGTILSKDIVKDAVKARKGNPLFLIDIAAPRDIEASIEDLTDVFLFTIDDLKKVVADNEALRQKQVQKSLDIIHEEIEEIDTWNKNRNLSQTIQKLRTKINTLAQKELEKYIPVTGEASEPQIQKMEKLAHSLTNKFLHLSISGIKKLNETSSAEQVNEYTEQVFDLLDESLEIQEATKEVKETEPINREKQGKEWNKAS
jgi:glutamyl-tRNA reductase